MQILLGSLVKEKSSKIDQISEWSARLNVDLNLFKSDDFDFKVQSMHIKYTPFVSTDDVWKII